MRVTLKQTNKHYLFMLERVGGREREQAEGEGESPQAESPLTREPDEGQK